MDFIQVEKMSAVNFFNAPLIGGWNLLAVLWVVLAIVWLVAYVYQLQNGGSREAFTRKAWWLLLLFWLPLALSSGLTFYNFLARGGAQLKDSHSLKQQARLCDIDKNHNFNGLLCGLYPAIDQVKARVKPGSSLCYVAYSLAQPFLNFGLYNNYGFSADCSNSDYFLAYLTEQKIMYTDDGHLILKSGEVGQEKITDYGRFAVPEVLGNGIFLLERAK